MSYLDQRVNWEKGEIKKKKVKLTRWQIKIMEKKYQLFIANFLFGDLKEK